MTYASTTASSPATIRDDLVSILDRARFYNSTLNISGVLFYGNDYFFQCLEGDEKQVDQLYQKILKDKRHKNVVLLTRETITTPKFNIWDMKYVMQEAAIQKFFTTTQWEKFNPYVLTDELIQPFLTVLYGYQESTPGIKEEVIHAKPSGLSLAWIIPVILMAVILLLASFLGLFH